MYWNKLPFDCQASYQIKVQGWFDPTWLDRLEGMTISLATGERGGTITTLEGELSDQSALVGVLNTLYGLHLTILSVERAKV